MRHSLTRKFLTSVLAGVSITAPHHVGHVAHLERVKAPAPIVSPVAFAQWLRVSWCETHDKWTSPGPWHFGGLGITAWNWEHFGGLKFASLPNLATPIQQVWVAIRIQGANPVPDRWGCAAW